MKICKNCGHRFEGEFCNHCGQTAETKRLNFHYLRHQLTHSLFHINAGLFYTIKQLFLRPGHAIRDYLEGKRVNYITPFSFVLILTGFYILLCHWLGLNLFSASEESLKSGIGSGKSLNLDEWFLSHFSWVTLATIPLYTAGTWICFYNKCYNFVEYLVLNTYKAGQRLIVQIVFLPFIFLIKHSLSIGTVMLIVYLIDLGLHFWTNIEFFNRIKLASVIIRSIFSHIILIILMFVALFLLMLLMSQV